MMHAGHGFKHTIVELHDDGSATIEHHHQDGVEHNKKYAVQDLDGIHDGLEEHLRGPFKQHEDELEEKVHPGIHEEIAKMDKGGK